ncbi:RNA exonuclease 3 [Saxophila tyrrhenica]|uniref:RNA exonuclease 3 n=1 Tax=Saxophila tyrrhenica TaxID=1690608 RepID=A0AAV9P9U5_9PEZI|nr:RNA exonuclease 3 [Saxophila tyrrhenica]
MVFSTTTLFRGIACPSSKQCGLTNCIFSHDSAATSTLDAKDNAAANTTTTSAPEHNSSQEPPTKRRKVTYENGAAKPLSRADLIRSELAESTKQPPSLSKSVSPPPTNVSLTSRSRGLATTNKDPLQNGVAGVQPPPSKIQLGSHETLNPRLIANDPVGHSKRSLFLKHLHGELAKLNSVVAKAEGLEPKHLLHLSDSEIIKIALDDEEKAARESSMLYPNIIKQRISFYRKMTLEQWLQHLKTTFITETPKQKTEREAKPLDTGLTPEQEGLIINHVIANQAELVKYGYIPTPPTEAEAAEAAAAVEASKNFEVCDRCGARFQMFPERNDEGQLTSNGTCKYHPRRKIVPQRTKGDVASGMTKEAYHPCCNGVVGSPGCTENSDHVFKTNSPARMAAVLPFITTPENDQPKTDKNGRRLKGVTFDCEMGYTTFGLELIRLTAVSWPAGDQLLDILVRPLGTVIDFNSRFSGVWPESFANAQPYGENESTSSNGFTTKDATTSPLPIVGSPQRARELLCQYLTPKTPLIGHAIDNDLNTVRLCHPTIVDTIVLFPHPRGLPLRFGLKMLTNRHLGRTIQNGGDQGHDSLEDAQATGDLVRHSIGEKWKLLSAQGWRMGQDCLIPPPSRDDLPPSKSSEEFAQRLFDEALERGSGAKKRKKRGSGDDNAEDGNSGIGVGAFLKRDA